jgi:hypothetical protein
MGSGSITHADPAKRCKLPEQLTPSLSCFDCLQHECLNSEPQHENRGILYSGHCTALCPSVGQSFGKADESWLEDKRHKPSSHQTPTKRRARGGAMRAQWKVEEWVAVLGGYFGEPIQACLGAKLTLARRTSDDHSRRTGVRPWQTGRGRVLHHGTRRADSLPHHRCHQFFLLRIF